jgi:hypothetical protein
MWEVRKAVEFLVLEANCIEDEIDIEESIFKFPNTYWFNSNRTNTNRRQATASKIYRFHVYIWKEFR